jgi:hypothetical protein
MTDTITFARQAEADLRASGALSPATCRIWGELPAEGRAAFAPALAFLGCKAEQIPWTPTPDQDRIAAARLMLLKLGLDTDDPRWSSHVLDRLVAAAMGVPVSSVGDLLKALYSLFGDYGTCLSREVGYFIKDLVVKCFTAYRESYEAVDWTWFVNRIVAGASPAQLYLALHAIPPQHVTPGIAQLIARGLEPTPYKEEALNALEVGP